MYPETRPDLSHCPHAAFGPGRTSIHFMPPTPRARQLQQTPLTLVILDLPASQAAASTSSRCAARSEAAIDFAGSQPGRPAHADSSKPSTAAGPQTGWGRPSSSCTSSSLARSESSSTVHGGDPESRDLREVQKESGPCPACGRLHPRGGGAGLSSTSSTDQRSERRLTWC